MRTWTPIFSLSLAFALAACKDAPKDSPKAAASAPASTSAPSSTSATASVSAPAAPTVAEAPAPQPSGSGGTGASVAFTLRAPVVGDVVEEREQLEVHLALEVGQGAKAKGIELTQKDSIVRKTKVLAVDGKAVTKLEVTYVERAESVSQNGKEKKGKGAVAGHTYVLTAKDGKIEIADDKGAAVPADQARFVLRSHRALGKPDAVLAGLPSTLKVGAAVPSLAAALEQRMHSQGDDAPTLTDVKVKLASVKDGVATFELTFSMSSTGGAKGKGGSVTQAKLKGTLEIRTADGLVSSLLLEGPLTLAPDPKAAGPKGKATGTGDMKMSFSAKR